MTLEILMSCMHQTDDTLVKKSGITGNVLVINQCDREDDQAFPTPQGTARMISTTDRGLTKSRNLAIASSRADICLLCDDDEVFVEDYAQRILLAYQTVTDADVIIFKMIGRSPSFPDKVMRLRFPKTMKVSSWQISFRRESLLRTGVRFDELLGAGTGNGAEEELKFLLDCQRAGLKIWYVPAEIASVGQTASTWFAGFNETFFYNRGATTRYILGYPLAFAYGVYYVIAKRSMYADSLHPGKAMVALMKGMKDNPVTHQKKALESR